MNKLANMEMFVRVVEAGSFAAAAEQARVTPTMVAKHVADIEKRLGAQLLHRTTRRHQLSEVGRLYYERCRRALAEVESAESSALELNDKPRGHLRMIAPVSFGSHCLVPALGEYMARHPEVSIDLNLEHRLPKMENGNFELGIHVGEVHQGQLVARPLRPYRRLLAASPDYLQRHGLPLLPEQLSEHRCLGPSYWRRHNQWQLVAEDGRTANITVRASFTATQGHALRMAALSGMGIVLQPEVVLADDLAAGHLLRVLPEWSLQPSPMHLVYAKDARPTAKLRSAVDFLMERFGL